jgi:hypothetical protein
MYKGIQINLTMSRTLYFEQNKDESDEDFLERYKVNIQTPKNVIETLIKFLQSKGIHISGTDLEGWEVNNTEYKVI